MKVSSRMASLVGSGQQAWEIHSAALKQKATDPEVIVLSVGDPDFATPTILVDAAKQALDNGDTHYTENGGRAYLRQLIADRYTKKFSRSIRTDHVAVVAGAQNGLYVVAACLLEAGDEVVVLDPAYVTYEATLKSTGATLVRVPALVEQGFRPDLNALERAITSKTKAIFFANPNNPTGIVFTHDELQSIAQLAIKHDLWVVSDEVYESLIFEGQHTYMAALPDMFERTITLSSLSKSHAMTGWRLGWVVGPPSVINHFINLGLNLLYGTPGFVQAAAVVGVKHYDSISSEMRDVYLRRRNLVAHHLADAPNIRLCVPQSGMFMMIDVRGTGLSAHQFSWELFKQYKVSLLDGAAFSPQLADFVRLSFSTSDEQLTEACQRIQRFLTQAK